MDKVIEIRNTCGVDGKIVDKAIDAFIEFKGRPDVVKMAPGCAFFLLGNTWYNCSITSRGVKKNSFRVEA